MTQENWRPMELDFQENVGFWGLSSDSGSTVDTRRIETRYSTLHNFNNVYGQHGTKFVQKNEKKHFYMKICEKMAF